jgi:hypothetical protein
VPNGNRQRSLLLGLGQDLINAVAELLCAAFILLAAASAAVPRATSFMMALDELSSRQLVR